MSDDYSNLRAVTANSVAALREVCQELMLLTDLAEKLAVPNRLTTSMRGMRRRVDSVISTLDLCLMD